MISRIAISHKIKTTCLLSCIGPINATITAVICLVMNRRPLKLSWHWDIGCGKFGFGGVEQFFCPWFRPIPWMQDWIGIWEVWSLKHSSVVFVVLGGTLSSWNLRLLLETPYLESEPKGISALAAIWLTRDNFFNCLGIGTVCRD